MDNNKKELESEDVVQDLKDVAKFSWTKIFKVLLLRMPIWLVLLVALIFGSFYGYSKFTKEEPVNLRPAITNAINVEITINTCNKQIDEQGCDIRDGEQKLEKERKETEGVKNAIVLIQRTHKKCNE